MKCSKYSISVSSRVKDLFSRFIFFSFDHFNFSPDERSSAAVQYLKTNELCEKILKWTMIVQFSLYVIPSITFFVVGTIYYYIHDGHIDTKKLFMPTKTRYLTIQNIDS